MPLGVIDLKLQDVVLSKWIKTEPLQMHVVYLLLEII